MPSRTQTRTRLPSCTHMHANTYTRTLSRSPSRIQPRPRSPSRVQTRLCLPSRTRYLHVHAPSSYNWERCYAVLYPQMMVLTWISLTGGRGVVTLDLLNATEVESTHSPTDPRAAEDYGTQAARRQSHEGLNLVSILCPFHLLYSDGIERLAAESPIECAVWVNAIWYV